MDPGVMLTFAAVRLEKSWTMCRPTMFSVLDDLKSKPFTDEEVNRAKTSFQKALSC